MCNATVEYTVPTKYSYKTLLYKCGSTGIDGYPVFCSRCETANAGRDFRAEAMANGENFDSDY